MTSDVVVVERIGSALVATIDREAEAAFVEKREPTFTGRQVTHARRRGPALD